MDESKIMNLSLFDGEGAGGDTGGQTDTQSADNTGVEATAETAPAAEEQQKQAEVSPEERERKFMEMIRGEYKDLYTRETQRIIDRRFRAAKETQETLTKQQGLIDLMRQRYGTDDIGELTKRAEDDNLYLEKAAEDAGMSVSQFKMFQKYERENARLIREAEQRKGEQAAQDQLKAWYDEAEKVKAKYSAFDLDAEAANPEFVKLLKAGVPMETAYQVGHMGEVLQDTMRVSAANAEKAAVENIRARGTRPTEAGASSQSGFTSRTDPGKMTKKQRAEFAQRALRGEAITFG